MTNQHHLSLFIITKPVIAILVVTIGFIIFSGCSSGYESKDGKITFNGKEITDKSFVVLNEAFAKNDSAVYYKNYSINGADMATFVALSHHYAKDKNTAFYCDEEREGKNYYLTKHSIIVNITDAQSTSFTVLGDGNAGYAKDSKRGYINGIAFAVKDAASLAAIDGQFVKDKYQVYFNQLPVKQADVNSFRLLNSSYAKDTAHVYYYGSDNDLKYSIHEIACDAASFTLLDYPYSKDKAGVFYAYTKINGADAASFNVIGNGYAKDKDHVYLETKIIAGADAASFMVIPHEETLDGFYYAKDKSHIFYRDKTVAVVNMAAFKVLGLGYATDGKQVYYHAAIVKNADPITFKVYELGYGDADAEDANNKYHQGKKAMIEE